MANNEIKISVVFAKAGASKNVKEFTGTLQEMEQTTKKTGAAAGKSFEKTNKSALKSFGKAGLIGLAATASGAVVLGYNRMIDKGSEFQQNLADLEAITGITGKDLDSLGARSLDTSVKYGESASNIIEANKLVASQLAEKIDFNTQEGLEQLQDISEQAIILQKAAGIDLPTAVGTLTTAVNQFNLPASETNRLINSIAAGSKFGAAEVAEQSAAYAEAGSVAASTNQSFEVLNASTQVLAANAIKGGKAGIGIRNVLLTMNNSAKLAEAGIEGVDLQADGLAVSLEKLKPLLSDSAALEKLFGRESITAAQILIKNADSVATMTEKVTGGNVALEQAEIQLNTYKGAQAQLAAAIDAQLIPAFQESNGAIVSGINLLIDLTEIFGEGVSGINDMVESMNRMRSSIGTISLLVDKYTDFIIPLRIIKSLLESTGIIESTEKYEKLFDEIDEGNTKIKAQVENIKLEAEEFKKLRNELDETNPKYASFTRLIKQNKEELESSKSQFETYLKNLREQREETEEGSFEYAQLSEQINQAKYALDLIASGLESVTKLTKENTKSVKENAGAFEGSEKQYDSISEAIKDKKKALEDLLDPTKEITKENWEKAKSLAAEIKGYEDLNARRKEYLDSIADGDPRPEVENPKPTDEIIDIDLPSFQAFDLDPEPILEASKAIKSLNEDVLNYITTSSVLGDHTNDINFAMQRTEQTISSLIENGYSPTGPAIQKLVNDYDKLKKAQQTQAAFMQAATNDQISSLRDLGNEVRAQVLAAIKARIAEAVATQIAKALATVPFPFNVAVAAAAGAAIPLLFNQIPKFEQGGKIGGKKHRDGGTLIEAERDEFITNRNSSNVASHTLNAINSDVTTASKIERFVTTEILTNKRTLEQGGKIGGVGMARAEKKKTLIAPNQSLEGGKETPTSPTPSISQRVLASPISNREPLSVMVDIPTVRINDSKPDNTELIKAIKEQTDQLSKVDRTVKILRSEVFDEVEQERKKRQNTKTVFD